MKEGLSPNLSPRPFKIAEIGFSEEKMPLSANGKHSQKEVRKTYLAERGFTNLIRMCNKKSNIGENLLERSFSPNPSPRTFKIAASAFSQGEKATCGVFNIL